MLLLPTLDLLARGGSIALLSMWCWILWRDYGRALAARMALGMNITIICHVIATLPGQISVKNPLDFLVELGSVAVPGFFWLFARTWFNDETRIGWRSWGAIAAALVLVTIQIIITKTTGEQSLLVGLVLRSAMFAFGIAGLWVAWQGREGDLVEARRVFRARLIWSAGLFVILVNGAEVGVWFGWLPMVTRDFIEIGIFLLTFSLFAAMAGLRHADLFDPDAPAQPDPQAVPADDPLAARLMAHMASEMPHRDETLTIAALAAQLGEQEYRLRRLINGTLGHRNFAAFLNGFRLAEVKAALADPSQREVPILTIALDAGFGSLGPFNRAFREAEGMTPSAFRVKEGKNGITQSRKAAKEGF